MGYIASLEVDSKLAENTDNFSNESECVRTKYDPKQRTC